MVLHEHEVASDDCRRLHELLLAHLRAVDAPHWPGADGLTLEEVLLSYPQAAAEGLVPDLEILTKQHPELAEVLRDFFGTSDKTLASEPEA